MDTQYNPQTRMLPAQLELPGIHKEDVSVTLSTCVWNRVRQVVVRGEMHERWSIEKERMGRGKARAGQMTPTLSLDAGGDGDWCVIV
jgi:HSP20 family molecular chaperone IbpA